MPIPRAPSVEPKFIDCSRHGPSSGAELLLVEGDSALASVAAVRSARSQAVMALQGKPMNAWRAPAAKVAQHLYFRHLAQALGLPGATEAPAQGDEPSRFERLVLLFDPDADGIHIGALMTLYIARWQPWLVAQGRLWLVRAPMGEARLEGAALGPHEPEPAPRPLFTPADVQAVPQAWRDELPAGGSARVRVQIHRGLGHVARDTLERHAVNPTTRRAHAVGAAEVAMAAEVFGQG